jgi:hypothetical protein
MKKENILKIAVILSLLGNVYAVAHLAFRNKKKVVKQITNKAEISVSTAQASPVEDITVSALKEKILKVEEGLQKQQEFHFKKVQEGGEEFNSYLANYDYDFLEKNGLMRKGTKTYKALSENLNALEQAYQPVADYFKDLDTTMLTEDECKRYKKYLKQMKNVDQLKKEFAEASDLKEKVKLSEKVSMMMVDVRGMQEARKVGLHTLAAKLGYKGDEVKKLTDYIQYIYKSTSWGIYSEELMDSIGVNDFDETLILP